MSVTEREQMAMPGVESEGAPARPTLVLVDGFALLFRAYHGMQQPLSTTTGEPVGAVFGFTRMLLRTLRDQRPDYILLTWDSGKTFRHEEFADYKAHRPPAPDDLNRQVERVRQVVEALNIPSYALPGYEADDVIGTLARQGADQGVRALILTGDRDLVQVVGPHIEVLTPGARRFDDARLFDEAEVGRRYGFAPALLPDFKALMGDTSDNIPGVPGIGEQTAKLLVAQLGSLEAILEGVEQAPKRVQPALREHAERARQSKRLATIVTNLPIELDLERCRTRHFDRGKVVGLFRELEFKSLLGEIPTPAPEADQTIDAAVGATDTAIVADEAALTALVARLRGQPFAVDTEADGLDPVRARLVGISLAASATEAAYLPIGHADGTPQLDLALVRRLLGPLLADPEQPKYAHHAKYDLLLLERHDLPVRGITFDSMIAAYLLNSSSVGLKELAFRELGREMTPIEDLIGRGKAQISMDQVPVATAAPYAGDDASSTYALVELLRPRLEDRGLMRLLTEVEMPLVPILAAMERWGVAVNIDELHELSKTLELKIGELEAHIHTLAGHPFNINSTQQLGVVLFEELGLRGSRRTQKGFSTASEVLEPLVDSHEIVAAVLTYRQLVKLKGTYVDTLPATVNPTTGRIHTSFNQVIASTGRLASINPNLQNIPIRTEVGRAVRRAFVADRRPEWRINGEELRLVSVDYSQIELRILAHFSADETLVTAFREGQDIHRSTAAEIYGVEPAAVTGDMRRIAKTVNFGVVYGLSAFGLARDTGLPRPEAAAFIEAYKAKFPSVFSYLDGTRRSVGESGYASTLLGRRRYLAEINSGNPTIRAEAERMAINAPIQGTAADMMKLAMIEVDRVMREQGLASRLLLQVHDELLFEAPLSEVERLAELVCRVMSEALPLSVPVECESKVGLNWEEMTPLSV